MEKVIQEFERQFALELPPRLREALLSDLIPNENVMFETLDHKVCRLDNRVLPSRIR